MRAQFHPSHWQYAETDNPANPAAGNPEPWRPVVDDSEIPGRNPGSPEESFYASRPTTRAQLAALQTTPRSSLRPHPVPMWPRWSPAAELASTRSACRRRWCRCGPSRWCAVAAVTASRGANASSVKAHEAAAAPHPAPVRSTLVIDIGAALW